MHQFIVEGIKGVVVIVIGLVVDNHKLD
jgi:hypothetical protein